MVMPTYMLPIAWHSAVCYVGRKRWIMHTSFREIFLSRMLGSFLILLENNVWKSAWSLFCYIMRPHRHSLTVAKWELWIEKSYRAEEKLPYRNATVGIYRTSISPVCTYWDESSINCDSTGLSCTVCPSLLLTANAHSVVWKWGLCIFRPACARASLKQGVWSGSDARLRAPWGCLDDGELAGELAFGVLGSALHSPVLWLPPQVRKQCCSRRITKLLPSRR